MLMPDGHVQARCCMHENTHCAINADVSATLAGCIKKGIVHSIQSQLKAEAHLPRTPPLVQCGGL